MTDIPYDPPMPLHKVPLSPLKNNWICIQPHPSRPLVVIGERKKAAEDTPVRQFMSGQVEIRLGHPVWVHVTGWKLLEHSRDQHVYLVVIVDHPDHTMVRGKEYRIFSNLFQVLYSKHPLK